MKVQLIVVQGKPEGKVIPLVGPSFKIGRGDMCHLRPNSEQVSREHAEFQLTSDKVTVRDLGSRNGTLVNGKALTEPATLKDRDLVQVGPLTFAVSIQEAPVAKAAPTMPKKTTSPDDISHDEIESWLIADNANPTPDRPSGVYGGDTITITAFKGNTPPKPSTPAPTPAPAPETTRDEDEPVEEAESEMIYDKLDDEETESNPADAETAEMPTKEAPEEFIDESNPFYVKKNKPSASPAPAKPSNRDSSDAASDILRKLMERRRGK